MYHVRMKRAGKLSELLTHGHGYVVHTSQGDICVFRSIAYAQYVAGILASYGLLG